MFLARLLMVHGEDAPDVLGRIADELEWLAGGAVRPWLANAAKNQGGATNLPPAHVGLCRESGKQSMYLFFAIVVAAVASLFSPGDIGDVPFSELTLRTLGKALATVSGYGFAFYLAGKSLDKDRIWPWRWTWPYFGNLVIRAGVIVLFTFGGIAALDRWQADGLLFFGIVGVTLALILYAMFSDEFEVFSDKGKRDKPEV